MDTLTRCFCVALVTTQVVLGRPQGPICSSYRGLCDISFEITEGSQNKITASSKMCTCPGNRTCPTEFNRTASIVLQELSLNDESIVTRLSYCHPRAIPKRLCQDKELAVTMRGSGPILLDIVGDVKCRCSTPLVLSKAYPDGIYSQREYVCRMPICEVNRSNAPVCERATTVAGIGVTSEIQCLCPSGFICNTHNLEAMHTKSGEPKEFRCEAKTVA